MYDPFRTLPRLRGLPGRFPVVLLTALLAACGSDSGPPDDGGNPPPGGGNPPPGSGSTVTREIGPGGGTIGTSDGAISLTFPAGALASATTITLQPATGSAPNGIGEAYEILPSGLDISQPVTLTMGVGAAQLGDADIGDVGIAVRRGGDWYADLTSTSSVAASRTGGAARLPRVVDGGEVSIELETRRVEAVAVVTFWKWRPMRPRVRTTESTEVTILACFGEDQGSIYTDASGAQVTTSRRIPTTCGPSVREVTWSLMASDRSTDPLVVGRMSPRGPSSVADYTAPARLPPGGSVYIYAVLYWPERNRTNNLHNFVLVDQSTDWGGSYSWTISGTDVRNIHSETFGYFDETTTITRDGAGSVRLKVVPGRANPTVATVDPSSIVARDHYKRVVVTITRGNGCETTKTETTNVEGAFQETLTDPPWGTGGEISIIFGDGNEYAISFVNVKWDEVGTVTTQSTTVCEGDDGDELPGLPTSYDITYELGPEMAGGFNLEDGMYHTTLNPASPHVLEGSTSWRDGIHPFATTQVTWSITRPL